MSLINEYFELTKQFIDEYGESTILLMQVGSFFEVYGILDGETDTILSSKIIEFSKICELNVVDKSIFEIIFLDYWYLWMIALVLILVILLRISRKKKSSEK